MTPVVVVRSADPSAEELEVAREGFDLGAEASDFFLGFGALLALVGDL